MKITTEEEILIPPIKELILETGGFLDSEMTFKGKPAFRQPDMAEWLTDGTLKITKTWHHGDFDTAIYKTK